MDINFITGYDRKRMPAFASDGLMIAMPVEKFAQAVSNISHAGAGRKS